MAESNIRVARVGQQVGDYRLLRLLGSGGFGEVYLAEHMRNHSQVAVKILQARLTHGEELKAFINEARTFRLKHPHIVPLLDFGVTLNDVPYLVMEYAPQGTLRERHPLGTRIPLLTVVSYVNQVASALQSAHDLYIIHRDVKPENMLVGKNGEILLTDFGIAAVVHNSYTLSKQQEGIGGTVSYMAPEQINGKPCPASDQYALGVLTYEWLSGKRPFQGTPVEVMMQHMTTPPVSLSLQTPMLTTEVEQVVFTALAKDPKQRFGSMRAFAVALTQASQQRQPFSLAVQSSPPSSPPLPYAKTMNETIPPAFNTPPNFGQAAAFNTPPNFGTPPNPGTPPNFGQAAAFSTPSNLGTPANNEHIHRTTSSTRWRSPRLSSPHNGSLWGRIMLFVIVLLLISGGTTFAYLTLSNHAKPHIIATPPTPTIAITPTAPDLPTDPFAFYTWLTSRQPANAQSFADSTLGWDTSNSCSMVNGNYQLSAQPSAGVVILASCLANKTNYTDFAFQVDMTMTRGETAGLIFRSNAVLNADYLFEVNSNNTYFLNASTLSLNSQSSIVSSSPFSGQTTNTVTVIARGHDIYLFINRHFLIHASDATTGSGQIGLFIDAQPTDQGGAIADFSNLKIWNL